MPSVFSFIIFMQLLMDNIYAADAGGSPTATIGHARVVRTQRTARVNR